MSNLFDVSLHYAMDYEFLIRVCQAGHRFRHLNRLCAAQRVHGLAKSVYARQQMDRESENVRLKYGQRRSAGYYMAAMGDVVQFGLLKVKGVLTLLSLYYSMKRDKQDLTVPLYIDSPIKAVLRQLNLVGRTSRGKSLLYLSVSCPLITVDVPSPCCLGQEAWYIR